MKRIAVLCFVPLLLLFSACRGEKEMNPLFFREPPCAIEGTWRKGDGVRIDFIAEADAAGALTLTVLSEGTLQDAVFSVSGEEIVLTKEEISLPVLRVCGICRFFDLFSLPRETLRSSTEQDGDVPLRVLAFDTATLTVRADNGLPCRFESGGEEFLIHRVTTNRIG